MRPWVAGLALGALVVGCSEGTPQPIDDPTDAGAGPAEESDAIVCPPSGVSKGPWTVGMTRTSVHVRWEACSKESKGDVLLDGKAIPSTTSEVVLTQRYAAAFNRSAPPDLPGTYFMHEATIEGLTPGTCYRYALAADEARGGRFCTAQPDGGTVHFLAIADTNPLLGTATSRVLSQVVPLGADFTIHAGDIQYYDSGLETWAGWFPVMQPLLGSGAITAAIGNHESEKEEELAKYALRFFGEPGQRTFHETESGGVHFFALDTEASIAPESEQGTWLLARLAEVSKAPGYRTSIVFFHKPLVTCGDTGQDDASRNRYAPAFVQNKVRLVVQGHMHGYERFELDGITYVTTGGGGGALGKVDQNVSRAECASRKASGAFFHAMDFTVEGGEIRARAVDDLGAIRDSFTVSVP